MKTIGWISGGASSLLACLLAKKQVDMFVYIDIPDQHEDTYRFLEDAEKLLDSKIITITAGMSVEDVCLKYGFISSSFGARCTQCLKRDVRKKFEKEIGETRNIWGFDVEEKKRAERIKEQYDNDIFPLIDENLRKKDVHFILKEKKIKLPFLYENYRNNNCIGCIKGGKGYWNKIRIDFPDVFKKRSLMERKIGFSIIKDIYLDELNPSAGKYEPVMPECSIFCQMNRTIL